MKPFKPGIAMAALGILDKHGINVNLVPCAFQLYKQHLFRSKVYMEFGESHKIPDEIVEKYKTDKNSAIAELIKYLENVPI
jgi:hypothetical protein